MMSYSFEIQPVAYLDYVIISKFVEDNMDTIELSFTQLYDDGKGSITLKGTYHNKGEFFEAAALLRTFLK